MAVVNQQGFTGTDA